MVPRRMDEPDEQDLPRIGVITRLLSEHTGKVQALVDRRDTLRSRRIMTVYLAGAAVAVVLTAFTLALPRLMTFASTTDLFLPLLVLPVVMLLVLTSTSAFTTDTRRERQLRRDVILAGRRLERVVQVAVQLSEHGLSDDLGTRLELELQIAEAQAVLTYADLEHERGSQERDAH